MSDLFRPVQDFVVSVPLEIWFAAMGVLILLIAVLTVSIRRSRLLKLAASRFEAGETDAAVTARLLKRPGLVEALIRRCGDGVVAHFEVSAHLVHRLEARKRPENARRLLKLSPEDGAFPVFLLALKKSSIAAVFRAWLGDNPDFLLLRKMAFKARGRDFDGDKARELLSPCFEEIRELSGDPEWSVRFFSLRVLLADSDLKSSRLIQEAFGDSHPLIRRTVAAEAEIPDRNELFDSLMTMVLDDPVAEVRLAARNRITSVFPERWKLDPSGMNALQSVHVLELLKTDSREDENIAINALQDAVVEARLAAARFLERSGALEAMFRSANLGDREDWERRRLLLSKAISVGVTGFLDVIRSSEKIDILLLGARLLSEGGDNTLITPLTEKVFGRPDSITEADELELYRTAITLSCIKGDERSRTLVRQELHRRRHNEDSLNFILPLLPTEDAPIFRDVLVEILEDPDMPAAESFLNVMSRLPSSIFLGRILDILEADRSSYDYKVRLRALHCLGVWHLDHTLQTILENLPILRPDQTRAFAEHLSQMDTKSLRTRAAYILASPDAGIRSALISCLPKAEISNFSKDIKDGLNDADPEVRIACLRALLDAGELKATTTALSLLRDPVERVRREAARIAGVKATDKFLKALEEVLVDTGESSVVRVAALDGLAASSAIESIDVMVRFLDSGEDLRNELLNAMALKTDRKAIETLVERFKDAEALLRDRIADVFVAMRDAGEDALVSLLNEDIASLNPFLADILTRTGFVEVTIRKLTHRKPEVRREAAQLLAAIATEPAYRGIILAARDPDKDVRIKVTRALESLATPAGEEILKSLEHDPDRKVRRYTHWAMERLASKKLP